MVYGACSPRARVNNCLQRAERLTEQPENPYSKLIPDQTIVLIPSFTLESGVTLFNVPVAYKSWGKLAPEGDNAMVVCHALSGSVDVGDWWGPLLGGAGRAFDVTRFFVICINSLGSPYGTASPVTSRDGVLENGNYGPEFPLTTIRDDVRFVLRYDLHRSGWSLTLADSQSLSLMTWASSRSLL